jgi:hypothetical protein
MYENRIYLIFDTYLLDNLEFCIVLLEEVLSWNQ